MRLIEDYLFSIKMIESVGHALGEKLVELLRPVIEDLTFHLGWEEEGIDTICFFSESHKEGYLKKGDKFLETVIEEVFPELKLHLDTPFGIYLKGDEIQKVKRILEEWKVQEIKEKNEAIKWAKKEIEEVK
jgi:hypothetical protein